MFGPDLEPLESESRRGAHPAGARHDSLTVAGAGGELVANPDDGDKDLFVHHGAIAGSGPSRWRRARSTRRSRAPKGPNATDVRTI